MKNKLVFIAAIIATLLSSGSVQAQVLSQGSITTAGADCSTTTRCSELIDIQGVPSVSVTLDVGTSGTFVVEYTQSAVTSVSQTIAPAGNNTTETVVWTALNDDIAGTGTKTADGTSFYTNPGYRYLRIRASAISGAATYRVIRGPAALKSTATLSGGGDASAANQVTGNNYLATLAGAVAGTEMQVDIVSGSVTASATNTDTDAATIAQGQTSDTVNNLNFIHNGTAWARLTFGQATMANSLPVTIASNQTALTVTGTGGTFPSTQSGTWTVQPGNTANTTAWLVTGTGGTFPATQSGTWTVQPGNTANTTAWYVTSTIRTPAGQSAIDDTADAVKVLNVDSTGATISPGVACTNVAVIDTAASGNTQLVALSGSTVIYICSYIITAEATVDVRLVRGTGTACATGETSITGTFAFSTTTGLLGVSRGSGLGMITKGNAGDAVCIETSGAVQINGEITYAQY